MVVAISSSESTKHTRHLCILCHAPNVSLSPASVSPNASSDLSFYRSRKFTILSEVKLDCELSYKTLFLWRVYQLGEEDTPLLSRNSFSELLITPHLLPVGEFLVRLNVSLIGTAVFGVSQGYFKVKRSPLVALIAGGSKVARGLNRTIIFDASLSYDPDEKNLKFSGLKFTWLCGREPPLHINNSDEAGCYYRAGEQEAVGHELRVNSSFMIENTSYFITVLVTKDERQAQYTQEVFIVPGDPPEVQIRCYENCEAKLNPSGTMALQGMCTGASCHGNLIFKWTVFKDLINSSNSSHWTEVLEIQELIRTRVSSKSLVIRPGVLTPNTRYKFILTAQRPGGYHGYSEYHVTSNSPPVGGVCNVSPTSGVSLITEFTFKCFYWQDLGVQLQYEFIYLTNNNLLNVAYKGVKTSIITKLPAGEKKNNFSIDFRVRVTNMVGVFTEVRTPVQVLEPSIEKENLSDIVKNLTTGDESELNYLIQSGDVSRALQLMAAAISVVDAIALAKTKGSQASELTEKRIMVTIYYVELLLKDAKDALEKMTSVLKAENVAGESYDSLYDGAKSLVNGLGSILRVVSHEASVYDSHPQKESHIKAGSITKEERLSWKSRKLAFRSRTSSRYLWARRSVRGATDAQLQARIHVESIYQSLKEIGSIILSRTVVGEEQKKLSAQATSLLILREEPDILAKTIMTNKGNSFQFTLPIQLANITQFVDSLMITTDFTPFSWDPSGSRVTTAVSSLELNNSCGHFLNTTELKAPITIRLQNLPQFKNVTQLYYVGANKTVIYKINVTQLGMALVLKIRLESNKTEILVTVKYGKRPSFRNSDLNLTIPDLSSCDKMADGYVNCSRDPYVVFVNQEFIEKKGLGYYFIGLTAVSRISEKSRVRRCSKRSCVQYKESPTTSASFIVPQYREGDQNYTIQVMPAACLFWNAEISQWTSEGCKVIEKTTQDYLHCSCNHLSAFGGQLFVAPTSIDFDKVFAELVRLPDSGNLAVIIAVSCVFGLYFGLLLWSRENDKLDLMKVCERAVIGVPMPWSHFVEVQVSTGIWRNSGTTANVFIVLEGELGTTRPYHLKQDSCIPFARGSIMAFVISIPVNIGTIKTVRVWHDNSGTSPSWFLNQIKVRDLFNKVQRNFVCFTWLAVDKGDGSIDRTLRFTSADDRGIDFSVYVQNRIGEEVSDLHLWFSVATRPPRYRFTRVQRLSCCLALLLTTMLTSAMFYEHQTAMDDTRGSLRLGRFVVNFREFIIGVQSLLVVFPAYILTVQSFARTRSSNENKRLALKTNARTKFSKRKRDFSFPHCFIFVPWLLCFLLSICAASFVIFYSLQWGADTSEQWLVSVAVSVLLDFFVTEPFQIIVVAFILPHIFKRKPDRSAWISSPEDAEVDLEDIKVGGLGCAEANEEELKTPKPLTTRKVRRARASRMREMYMYTALRNIVSYLLYLLILLVVCYGGRSEHGYLMTSSMKNTFGELNKISDHFNTWNWLRDVLVPGLFEDGKDVTLISSSPFIGDGDAVLVGMPRLRQLRVKEGSCDVSIEELTTPFNSCVAAYTFSNEDKTSFHGKKWRLSSFRNESVSSLPQVCPSAWHYSSARQTLNLPLWGRLHLFNFYGEGGYLAELGYDKTNALKVVSELNLFDWINRFTSAVIFECAVFNSQVNLFSVIWILIEFSPSGLVVSNHMIHTMHIYDIGGGYSTVTITCQLLLVVYIIYFVIKETRKMVAGIRMYFSRFLNWVELLQTITVIFFLIAHIMKETELFATTAKLRKNTFQFISFDWGVLLQDMETVLISLLMFLNTVKLLYLLKYNPRVRRLFYAMKRSALVLVQCSIVFAVFMFGCIHVGYLLFGRELYSFSSPFIVLQSLLVEGVVGGGVDYFNDCCTIIGPVYFTAIKMAVNLIFINIFISVLVYNYGRIRELSRGKFALGHFVIMKAKELLGCVGDRQGANGDISTHDLPNTGIEEDVLPEVTEILAKLDQINHLLNVHYAEEFCEDLELFSLWFDLHMQAKKSKDVQENWVDAQDSFEAAVEEDWVDAQE
ncbi:Polycystic kidney disease protein 1-like 2 [Stylophora pistillata]|uniref:Polycystic kidney disease protein 1-like 2 n=1 Tax=Stylophora pistillata TaxID=50429 RepID=A0A2B4T0F5_STYPI|nr:Polycystic kidney disease protein 1-like 2 [Stylophora pistillata]